MTNPNLPKPDDQIHQDPMTATPPERGSAAQAPIIAREPEPADLPKPDEQDFELGSEFDWLHESIAAPQPDPTRFGLNPQAEPEPVAVAVPSRSFTHHGGLKLRPTVSSPPQPSGPVTDSPGVRTPVQMRQPEEQVGEEAPPKSVYYPPVKAPKKKFRDKLSRNSRPDNAQAAENSEEAAALATPRAPMPTYWDDDKQEHVSYDFDDNLDNRVSREKRSFKDWVNDNTPGNLVRRGAVTTQVWAFSRKNERGSLKQRFIDSRGGWDQLKRLEKVAVVAMDVTAAIFIAQLASKVAHGVGIDHLTDLIGIDHGHNIAGTTHSNSGSTSNVETGGSDSTDKSKDDTAEEYWNDTPKRHELGEWNPKTGKGSIWFQEEEHAKELGYKLTEQQHAKVDEIYRKLNDLTLDDAKHLSNSFIPKAPTRLQLHDILEQITGKDIKRPNAPKGSTGTVGITKHDFETPSDLMDQHQHDNSYATVAAKDSNHYPSGMTKPVNLDKPEVGVNVAKLADPTVAGGLGAVVVGAGLGLTAVALQRKSRSQDGSEDIDRAEDYSEPDKIDAAEEYIDDDYVYALLQELRADRDRVNVDMLTREIMKRYNYHKKPMKYMQAHDIAYDFFVRYTRDASE